MRFYTNITQWGNNLLLRDWELVTIMGSAEPLAPLSQIKIISFKEKNEWILETKYNIGKKREA